MFFVAISNEDCLYIEALKDIKVTGTEFFILAMESSNLKDWYSLQFAPRFAESFNLLKIT
jgi:hypothetical protein